MPTRVMLPVNDGTFTLNLYDLAVWVIGGLSAGFLASRLTLGYALGPVQELPGGLPA